MRDYAVFSPRFWTSDTGKRIKAAGRDVQIVAVYLFTSPTSNMIGLYYLPLPTLCHEVGIDNEGALKALRSLEDLHFCRYSPFEEVVFVFEMAKWQVGDRLAENDNRVKGVIRELENYRKSSFLPAFMERYSRPFHLPKMEAPSKPLRSQEQEQDQEQEQEQEQEEENISSEAGVPTSKPPSPPAALKEKPAAEVPLIVFPTTGGAGKPTEWGFCKSHGRILRDAYPAVDILQEIKKALAWIMANPKRRKTARGTFGFLNRWMARQQDKGGGGSANGNGRAFKMGQENETGGSLCGEALYSKLISHAKEDGYWTEEWEAQFRYEIEHPETVKEGYMDRAGVYHEGPIPSEYK